MMQESGGRGASERSRHTEMVEEKESGGTVGFTETRQPSGCYTVCHGSEQSAQSGGFY